MPPLLVFECLYGYFGFLGYSYLVVVDRLECRCLCVFAALVAGNLEVESRDNCGFEFWFHGFSLVAGCHVSLMEAVMPSVKLRVVRDPMAFDTHLFDPGLDCSRDLDTGKELTSMTKQSFRDECDINTIMRRYERTGVLDHLSMQVPQFGEYMGSMSYQESLNAILYAQSQFAELSAEIRDRFANDPVKLLEFMEDPSNRAEAVKLGLVQPEVIPVPPKPLEPAKPASVADTPPAERPAVKPAPSTSPT